MKACGQGKPWAVKNQAKPGGPGTSVVPGGCHPSRKEALRHQRALYANVPDATAVALIDDEIAADLREGATARPRVFSAS